MQRENPLPCPACQVGRLHLRLVTYSHVYGETLVSVPNTPAWECDVCHTLQYDTHSVQRIEALIDQAGPPPNRHHSRPRTRVTAKPPAVPPEG